MKIRVTIMTENDKHLDEKYTKEQIEAVTKRAWQAIVDDLLLTSEDTSERAVVESCELVER